MDDHTRREFTDFVTARTPSLLRLAYVLTGDRFAAEDLLQNALTRTAGRWRHIRDNPEAYVRKAMYHEQVSRWRSPRWGRESVQAGLPERGGLDPADEVDLKLSLRRALRLLAPRQRAVLVLRYFEDLPETEVAQVMGCSVGTVRSQTAKALTRLRAAVPTLAAFFEEPLPDSAKG